MNNNELKPRRWLLVVFIIIAIAIVIVLLNKLIIDHNKRKNNQESRGIFESINNVIENQINDDKWEKKSFNNKFEQQVGTNNGISAGWLIDDIITNNKTNSEHIITVVYKNITTNNSEEIKNIKRSLDDWTNYELSLDYDEKGYVNKLTIED